MPLTDTLTGIANAIRTKDGTTAPIPFLDMPQRVLDIPSGGGPVEVKEKDINFFDYDGTLLYSYTLAEAAALTELPPGPEHERLVFQQWNYSIKDVKTATMPINIGPYYTTKSGKIEIDITLTPATGLTITVYPTTGYTNSLWTDWGDGTTITSQKSHTYSDYGDYTITFTSNGSAGSIPLGTNKTGFFGESNDFVKRVFLANMSTGFKIPIRYTWYTFCNSRNLEAVSVYKNMNSTQFVNCDSLKFLVTSTELAGDLGVISLANNFRLKGVSLSPDAKAIYATDFLNNAHSLKMVIIPASVTTIPATAFKGATGVLRYYFHSSTPPTLANANVFEGINKFAKIIVPKGALAAYQAATNWSTYAAYMEEAK